MGLDYFSKIVYDRYSLDETINAFNKINNFSIEEKEQIEQVVEFAVNWWIDNTDEKKYSDDDDELKYLHQQKLKQQTKKGILVNTKQCILKQIAPKNMTLFISSSQVNLQKENQYGITNEILYDADQKGNKY